MPLNDREAQGKPHQSEGNDGKVFIPAKPKVHFDDPAQIFRVCAYCRVSTDSEEQLSSLNSSRPITGSWQRSGPTGI